MDNKTLQEYILKTLDDLEVKSLNIVQDYEAVKENYAKEIASRQKISAALNTIVESIESHIIRLGKDKNFKTSDE